VADAARRLIAEPLPKSTAIQNNERILELTSTQTQNINDINTTITTTNISLRSLIPHQPSPAHRIDRARVQ
jgi:hypothetical protein